MQLRSRISLYESRALLAVRRWLGIDECAGDLSVVPALFHPRIREDGLTYSTLQTLSSLIEFRFLSCRYELR